MLVEHYRKKGPNARIKGIDRINKTNIYDTYRDLYMSQKEPSDLDKAQTLPLCFQSNK